MAATPMADAASIKVVRNFEAVHASPFKVLVIVEGKRGNMRTINLRISGPVRVKTLKSFICAHMHIAEDQLNFQYNLDGTYDPEFMLMTEHAPDEVAYFNYFAQRVDPPPAGVASADQPGESGAAVPAGVASADQPDWADEARRFAADDNLDLPAKMSCLVYIYTVMPKVVIPAPVEEANIQTFETGFLNGQDNQVCLIYILNFIKKALNAPMTPREKLIMFSIACKWIATRLALPPPESYGELTVVFRTLIGELVAPPSPADQPDGGETSIQD